MRITGGQQRGRTLAPFKGINIRPTSDRVREATFSILGQDMTGQWVMDLFAGTGSLGLEALSRGALGVLFVDSSPASVKLIKVNLALCGYEDSGSVLRRDLTRGLPYTLPIKQRRFDLVFLDPPYTKGLIVPVIKNLQGSSLLCQGSYIVTQSSKNEEMPLSPDGIRPINTRLYGNTRISFYICEESK